MELCVRPGCTAKMTPLRKSTPALDTSRIAAPRRTKTPDFELSDPSRPCAFLGRDGRPCRRPALDNGACRFHKKDADLLMNMTRDKEDEELLCPPLPQTIDEVVMEGQECIETQDATTQASLRGGRDDPHDLVKELRDTVYALRKENAKVRTENADLRKENARLLAKNASRDADLLLMRTEVLRVIDRLVE